MKMKKRKKNEKVKFIVFNSDNHGIWQ